MKYRVSPVLKSKNQLMFSLVDLTIKDNYDEMD